MPDAETLTPPAGTDESLTPSGGTETPLPAIQGTEQDAAVAKRHEEQARGRETEAFRQREIAQRLYAENQRLAAENQRLAAERQAYAAPPPAPARISEQQYNDAIVEGRHDIIKAFHEQERRTTIQETRKSVFEELNAGSAHNQKMGSFNSFLQSVPGLADPKGPLWQEAAKEYRAFMMSPQFNHIDKT